VQSVADHRLSRRVEPIPVAAEPSLGAALVLVVLLVNLSSRWFLRRQLRLAGQL